MGNKRRSLAGAAVAAGLVAGGLAAPGIAAADSGVVPLAAAPSCVGWSEYRHGNPITGYYTNVYVDNNCSYTVRVKVIMDYGSDSGCMTIQSHVIDVKFRSTGFGDLYPELDRIDLC
ncbi:hypothetical protein [Amycolatopsis sp. YIM 10]|uniref:hypothetical protein n=1 Tax=Amycolatopsis sp. YIM 10 TaxID=2653857 RepID=UPI0012901795|nr:hypothetical protein [Amycolatopsis sp. YIM 10]QFU92054.1 hypothetical protein YIM_34465 [Amycolatopsis sp. YIM 10]